MKAPTGKLAFAYRTIAALECERDSLREDSRQLHQVNLDWADRYVAIERERDTLRAEVERLTGCLKRANSQAEHFEREWYLRGDEVERLERIVHYLIRIYVVSDDEYDPEAATDRAISRIKEQIK